MKQSPVIRVNPRRISRKAMLSAAQILLRGGLVAYPTETVYGLGANALDPEAINKIYQVKGRMAHKPLIVLARNLRQVKELVDKIPPQAKILADHFWPDGLTLIFPASPDIPPELLGGGTDIAVRISGHRMVRVLLEITGTPLISTSANRSGRPAACSAEGVQRQLGGLVDLILDGGPSTGAVPSTVLDVCTTPVRVIRQGRVPIGEIRKLLAVTDDIGVRRPSQKSSSEKGTSEETRAEQTASEETTSEKMPSKKMSFGRPSFEKLSSTMTVLFVCTGNTCRSAMAQGLLQKMLDSNGIGHVRVLSAGTAALKGERAAPFAQQIAQQEDHIDLSGHSTHPLTKELLEEADLILAMALSHARHIESLEKRFARKTHLLTSFPGLMDRDPEDIDDPVGGSQMVYRRVYGRIKRELQRIFPDLVQGPQPRNC